MSGDEKRVKQWTVMLEYASFVGRLADFDVHYFSEWTVKTMKRRDLGLPGRPCYICGQLATLCARSKRHDLETIQHVMAERLATEIPTFTSER
ncbi:MAG: citrate lyase holo-[acyl-carrier protein] synthase [Aerococcus sp.]|nr:citrate lyase holo-[acyl-carrier protein] synthase [Aerococcus sp.]